MHVTTRPPVPSGSTAFQKYQRLSNWTKFPERAQLELQAYENAAADAKKNYMKLESDYESWLHDFAISRRIISDALAHCTRGNERLRVATRMVTDKCSIDMYSKKSKKTLPLGDMLDELESRDGVLIGKMADYEALIKDYSLNNKHAAAMVTSIDIEEIDYPADFTHGCKDDIGSADCDGNSSMDVVFQMAESSADPDPDKAERKRSTRIKSVTKRDYDDLSTSYVSSKNIIGRDIGHDASESMVDEDFETRDSDDIDLYRVCRALEDSVRAAESSIGSVGCFFRNRKGGVGQASYRTKSGRTNDEADDNGGNDEGNDDNKNDNNVSSGVTFDVSDSDRKAVSELIGFGRDEGKWIKKLNHHIRASESGARLGRGRAQTISMRTFATGRTPYGVPLLLGPSSVYPDGYLGFLEGGLRGGGGGGKPAMKPRLDILEMDKEVQERAYLQSTAASAATKLNKLRHLNFEWSKQLRDSRVALVNAERRIQSLSVVMAEEARCIEKELVHSGLAMTEMPLSPLVQWPHNGDSAASKAANGKKDKKNGGSSKNSALFPAPPAAAQPNLSGNDVEPAVASGDSNQKREPVASKSESDSCRGGKKSSRDGGGRESSAAAVEVPPAKKGRWAGHVKKG